MLGANWLPQSWEDSGDEELNGPVVLNVDLEFPLLFEGAGGVPKLSCPCEYAAGENGEPLPGGCTLFSMEFGPDISSTSGNVSRLPRILGSLVRDSIPG